MQGSCLCGAVVFEVTPPMRDAVACHCTQCRKTSGHHAASFDADEASVHWQARKISEHVSPGGGVRGFCSDCGSGLYFRAPDGHFSLEAGAVEPPSGGRLVRHIFVADKGDYYELTDGLPQE